MMDIQLARDQRIEFSLHYQRVIRLVQTLVNPPVSGLFLVLVSPLDETRLDFFGPFRPSTVEANLRVRERRDGLRLY